MKCCKDPELSIEVLEAFDIYEKTRIICIRCKKEIKTKPRKQYQTTKKPLLGFFDTVKISKPLNIKIMKKITIASILIFLLWLISVLFFREYYIVSSIIAIIAWFVSFLVSFRKVLFG